MAAVEGEQKANKNNGKRATGGNDAAAYVDFKRRHVSPQKLMRLNIMTEEEICSRTLTDIMKPNLDIVFIGINPGYVAATTGRWYAGPGNHFWKLLYMSELIPEPLTYKDDTSLPKYGIGLTNMCDRTTKGSNDLSKQEIREGGEKLREKLIKFKPKIVVFNGKEIYRIFCGRSDFMFGKQPAPLEGSDGHTSVFVTPSSSARTSQWPRPEDKLPYYVALRRLRDHRRGTLVDLDESLLVFDATTPNASPKKLAKGGSPKKQTTPSPRKLASAPSPRKQASGSPKKTAASPRKAASSGSPKKKPAASSPKKPAEGSPLGDSTDPDPTFVPLEQGDLQTEQPTRRLRSRRQQQSVTVVN